ncbi:uncharacterized protein LOC142568133 [Dermacentor variabilis]|uniref:uncharacterized protein LOC142568133 n=1 Tax=Dermacentor variabilis TaxID=34621 RepID=UPI003F5B731F
MYLRATLSSGHFSGLDGAAAMQPLQNPFLFVVQILAFLGTWQPLDSFCEAIVLPLSPCYVRDQHYGGNATSSTLDAVYIVPRLGWPFPSPTTPVSRMYLRATLSSGHFSGLDGAAAMQPLQNPFLFVVQVGKHPALHAKRSSNICLLLFPGPLVILCDFFECIYVVKLLMLAGDVEQNPGPQKEILDAIAALSAKSDARHTEVIGMLSEVRANQQKLEEKVSSLASRLATVESLVESYEANQNGVDLPRVVDEAVRDQTAAITSRLDELEDRSRRDNLIFYGIPDVPAENWSESETKIRNCLTNLLQITLIDEAISRAHRLGTYAVNKHRPIIVKFSSSKLKQKVFTERKKFKGSGISVSEDFCRATHLSQKKLIEFGKASGQKYVLRLNRLQIDKKTYVYCPVTDRVCEIHTNELRSTNSVPNAPSDGPSNSQT